jgi:ribosomal protein L11
MSWMALGPINHSVDEAIQITDGHDPKWVTGKHPALNYRGNAIQRDKIWLQSEYDQGLKRYGYTGWQWKVSGGTKRDSSIPVVKELFDTVNGKYELQKQMNAFIITRYNSGQDCIGFHSDKTKDFAKGSVFVVIKLGQPRPFEFSWDEPEVASAKVALKKAEKEKGDEAAAGLKEAKANLKHAMKNRPHKEIFFSKELAAGTAIIVGTAANARVKHGVPPIEQINHLSGSIVGRCIETVIEWDVIKKKLEQQEKQIVKKRKML